MPALSENPSRMPIGDLCRQALAPIPTWFGRLVYLAGLRDPMTGHYDNLTLTSMLGAEDADRAIRYSHHQVFSQWLTFNLAQQKSDLEEFIRASHGLRTPAYYRTLVPPTAREVERQLYTTDLETLLELLRCEHAGDVFPRETSQHR